jgi:eukaryotic-like serine/threonine-protein kinase
MAVVYLARDLKHDRDVAIKVLPPELSGGLAAERFLREVRIAAALQHPAILGIHDSGVADGLLFYAMPYVHGESLRACLDREKQLPFADVIRITRQVAEGLTHAHKQGVVHRDIKPGNILLADGYAVISDFGVARAIGAAETGDLTATGLAVGTPLYMSPEQSMGGQVDARTDIYALGCVVYEMLAGEPPFTGPSSQAIVARHVQAPPPSLQIIRETISDRVQGVVEGALRKVPADRYRTAVEFADALEKALSDLPSRRRPTVPPRRIAVGAVAAVAVALAGWWGATRRGGADPPDPDRVAVAPFEVMDAALQEWSTGLAELLSRNLDGAGPLRSVPASAVRDAWRGQADVATTSRLLRATGAGLGLFGTVVRTGADSARVTVRILGAGGAAGSGVLGEVERVAGVGRIDQAADSLTVALLQALSRVRPVAAAQQATIYTAPIPALKAFLQGEQYFRRTVWDSALQRYERAAALDSTYALALHRIYQVREYRGTGNDSLIWDYALQAGRLARGLAPRESLLVAMDSLMASVFYAIARQDTLGRARRERLLATAELAARRFPDDAEIWYQLGFVRLRVGWPLGVPQREGLDALERALALDPGFGPAYLQASQVLMTVRGADATREVLERYLKLGPGGLEADAARLALRLLDPRTTLSPEVQRTLDTASSLLLFTAQRPLVFWPDSAETMVRLGREVVRRSRDPHFGPTPDIARYLLALYLGWRGHLAEAAGQLPWQGKLFGELVWLGGIPADSGARAFAALLRQPLWPRNMLGFALPWWAETGDTGSIASLIRLADSAGRSAEAPDARRYARYLADAARAWAALARGDTAAALPRFLALPDTASPSGVGDLDRLAAVRLLRAMGRYPEAAVRLVREVHGTPFPTGVLWELERARVADGLGERAAAIRHYTTVAEAWARADEPLRPIVREAREALARLRTPGR